MGKPDLKMLLEKYRKGDCTPEEKALIESWYISLREEPSPEDIGDELISVKNDIWVNIKNSTDREDIYESRTIRLRWYAINAAIVLMVIGFWYTGYKNNKVKLNTNAKTSIKNKIVPGSNKAILTLANGHKINLSDASKGKLAEQAGIKVSKAADGKLVYTVAEIHHTDSVNSNEYNMIETPRGGQYQVNLPDGTKVWLNAASSLRYPTHFKAIERRVELAGEAYFEVAHNKDSPFIVSSQKQEIRVLGTHFNINAYADEATVNTTLLEGSVQVSLTDTHLSRLLKPGQQAQVNQHINVVNANVQEAIAWKNGMIKFTNQNIRYVMRMISRWYNVDVVYDGHVSNVGFGGSVSRSMNISEILGVLETTGYVHFKVEGRSVIVMP